jgi:hypothetical protein
MYCDGTLVGACLLACAPASAVQPRGLLQPALCTTLTLGVGGWWALQSVWQLPAARACLTAGAPSSMATPVATQLQHRLHPLR